MNKEYGIWDKDKIFVLTEKGISVRENSDNIEEILLKENLLEMINKKIEKLKEEIEKIKVQVKNNKKSIIYELISSFIIFNIIYELIIKNIDKATIINTRFGPTNGYNLILNFTVAITMGEFLRKTIKNLIKNRKLSKRQNEITNGLEYYEKTYEIEKTKLEELENEKTNNTDDLEKYEIKQVNIKESLEKMREELIAYCSEKEEKTKTKGQKTK